MKGKIFGLILSILIVVGLALGLVFGIRNSHKHHSNDQNNDPLSQSSKAISAVCDPTDYKEACVESLDRLSNNETATPKDYLQEALNFTINAITASIGKSANIGQSANDSLNKMGFQDCKELLDLAIVELQTAASKVDATHVQEALDSKGMEVKNWLSASVSYKEGCIDGINQSDLKDLMQKNLANSTQLISNLLAMVSEMDTILETFYGKPTNRRLLNTRKKTTNFDLIDGYPSWLSSKDRKLLGSRIMGANPRPNVIVAPDGSGQFRTISAALSHYPNNFKGRYVIYVKAGIYREQVIVTQDQTNIFMYGDGPRRTIVTGSKNFHAGVSTYQTASFAAIGNNFMAKSMGFQNTAGPEGHQAVALRVQSDMSVFYNCRMDGYQDTLYAQTHRQFYRNCVISGTIDFIFGDSNTFIQNSLIIVRQPMHGQQNTVTAQGKTDKRETTGIVIHNCRVVPEQKLFPIRFTIPTYLGRPWKQYSTTLFMQSTLSDFIDPAGWMPWAGNFALDTLFYAEYANRGPGANTGKRVNWKGYHALTDQSQVTQFTIDNFMQGSQWIQGTGVPFIAGLKN